MDKLPEKKAGVRLSGNRPTSTVSSLKRLEKMTRIERGLRPKFIPMQKPPCPRKAKKRGKI